MYPAINDIPILIIIFNRPDKVRTLITALEKIKPKYVYIAADGPRTESSTDNATCLEARTIATNIPWDCEVRTLFQDTNLGCKIGVTTAITWFFEHVPEGIILEDDCIPRAPFFTYCAELLERYRNESSVMHISGTSFLDTASAQARTTSYFFSNITLVWGWATWRRAWNLYDANMKQLDTLEDTLIQRRTFSSAIHLRFWVDVFKHIRAHNIDTWDGQWGYSILAAKGICIIPTVNMIENIGFDDEATHTKKPISFAQPLAVTHNQLTHPDTISIDYPAEAAIMRQAFINTPLKHLKYAIKTYLSP